MELKQAIRTTLEAGFTVQEEQAGSVVFILLQNDIFHIVKIALDAYGGGLDIECFNFNEAYDQFLSLCNKGSKVNWEKEGF